MIEGELTFSVDMAKSVRASAGDEDFDSSKVALFWE